MNAAAAGAILIVVTSHGQIDPQHPTGLRLEHENAFDHGNPT